MVKGDKNRKCFLVDGEWMQSLAQIVEIARSERRTVQFWVESGALIPSADTNRAGRGVHRQFDRKETIIACVLGAVSQAQIPIGRLIAIANSFRRDFLEEKEPLAHVEAAIAGKANVFLILEAGFNLALLVDPSIQEVYKHTVGDLLVHPTVGDTMKIVLFLTPCLQKVPPSKVE